MKTLDYLVILVSAVWVATEILINIVRYSKGESAKQLDKSSFSILLAAHGVCISAAVFVMIRGRFTGVGRVSWGDPFFGYVGLTIVVAGVLVRRTAIRTLKKQFTVNVTIVEGHEIIDHGIYRYVRHPAYLGSLAAFLGLGVAYENWISVLVLFIPLVAAYLYRISVEEKVLLGEFGEACAEYSKRTKRLIPKVY